MGCYGDSKHLKATLKKKIKQSKAAFPSNLKMFMTRKGKVGVKCFLAKSVFEKEIFWAARAPIIHSECREENGLLAANTVA